MEESMKLGQDLPKDPLYSQSFDSIVDISQLESVSTRDEIDTLSRTQTNANRLVGKMAIVAPSDIQFGVGRMYETVSELNANPQKIHVFRNSASALKWLDREGIDIEKIFEEIKGATF